MNSEKFFRSVLPAIAAMLVTSLYVVVDGIFVGKGIGHEALAAVNITTPFVYFATSVSMMFTMGAATLVSINIGKGDIKKANSYASLSLQLMLLFALVITLLSLFFSETIAVILGANTTLLQETADYIKYFIMFSTFFCTANLLSALVRNDANPNLAFWGMAVGAISNIFLDWLFIFPLQMGVVGAAIASGLGQVFACILLSSHFIKRKGVIVLKICRFSLMNSVEIIKTGVPEFVTQMSQPIVILCYNFLVIRIFGEIGVAAFSAISYTMVMVFGVFTGVAQGVQPLLSRSFGEKNKVNEKFFLHKAIKLNILLSIFIYFVMFVFGKNIISIFNNNKEMILIAYQCIKIYGLCFIFAAINIIFTVYYLSTKRTKQAFIVSILRSFIVNASCIFLMPIIFGESAIWTGMVVAEILVMIIAIIMDKYNMR